MFLVEINRGCPYGCRFCAAGYVYRPPRQSRLADVQALIEQVSPRKIGLVGTSTHRLARSAPVSALAA